MLRLIRVDTFRRVHNVGFLTRRLELRYVLVNTIPRVFQVSTMKRPSGCEQVICLLHVCISGNYIYMLNVLLMYQTIEIALIEDT